MKFQKAQKQNCKSKAKLTDDLSDNKENSRRALQVVSPNQNSYVERVLIPRNIYYKPDLTNRYTGLIARYGTQIVERLNCSGCQIGSEDIGLFSEMLKDNRTLTYLNLSHNYIDADALRQLIPSLSTNSKLKQLNLAHNQIDNSIMFDLKTVFETNFYLRCLKLKGNEKLSRENRESLKLLTKRNRALQRKITQQNENKENEVIVKPKSKKNDKKN